MAAPGSRSEGFSIKVFPVTAARGIVQRGIILKKDSQDSQKKPINGCITHAGKLNGAILANTPRGTFLTSVSISLLTAVDNQQR
jgi:hypothetical protein